MERVAMEVRLRPGTSAGWQARQAATEHMRFQGPGTTHSLSIERRVITFTISWSSIAAIKLAMITWLCYNSALGSIQSIAIPFVESLSLAIMSVTTTAAPATTPQQQLQQQLQQRMHQRMQQLHAMHCWQSGCHTLHPGTGT
eukprot:6484226-Amphidinium_carterae.1